MPNKLAALVLPDHALDQLPLGFRKLAVAALLPSHIEERLLFPNRKFRFLTGACGPYQPISKPSVAAKEEATREAPEHDRVFQAREGARLERGTLRLSSDCVIVRGARYSAIYDWTRREIIRIPVIYHDLLDYLQQYGVEAVLSNLPPDIRVLAEQFVGFLHEEELVTTNGSSTYFKEVETAWESPSCIQTAVIDVDKTLHDFPALFRQLDELGCQFVQIRCFSTLIRIEDVPALISTAYDTAIAGIELLLMWDKYSPEQAYLDLMNGEPLIYRMIVHGASHQKDVEVDYGPKESLPYQLSKKVTFAEGVVDSEQHCGFISPRTLSAPTVAAVMENKLFNGCLNRKVGIDKHGIIKNCPSMASGFGTVSSVPLRDVVARTDFQRSWTIRKDQVEICRDCEYRLACSDCRAYTQSSEGEYSKPARCGYDPYIGEWSSPPLRQDLVTVKIPD